MKIYKLTNEEGLIYIGKTNCKYLSTRLAVHKSQALTSRKINKCSSSILFNSNVKIEFLEETEDKLKELYYINLYDCVNKMKTGLTYKESKKNWNKNNPEYYNLYYNNNKETIKKTQEKYRDNNKEKEQERVKKYYHNNIEKIKQSKQEEILCECGTIIKKCRKARHIKSNKHINIMNKIYV